MAGRHIHVRELCPDLPMLWETGDGRVASANGPAAPGDIALRVAISRASEYFNFFICAVASVLVFPRMFFPHVQPLEGMLWALLIFFSYFVIRPLGAAAFMGTRRHFGEKAGLVAALLLSGVSTAGLALVPGYAQIGLASIVWLVLLRFAQGLAAGGASDALPAALALTVPGNRAGWHAMAGDLGASLGFLFAVAVFACLLLSLSSNDFLDWGWRYPFFVAFALHLVTLFVRLRLAPADGTPGTRSADIRESRWMHTIAHVSTRWPDVLPDAVAQAARYSLFCFMAVFPLAWASLHGGGSTASVLLAQMAGGALAVAGMLMSGFLPARFSQQTIYVSLACSAAVLVGLAPTLLQSGQIGQNAFILSGFCLLGFSFGRIGDIRLRCPNDSHARRRPN